MPKDATQGTHTAMSPGSSSLARRPSPGKRDRNVDPEGRVGQANRWTASSGPMAEEICSETGRWTDTALDPVLPEVLPGMEQSEVVFAPSRYIYTPFCSNPQACRGYS